MGNPPYMVREDPGFASVGELLNVTQSVPPMGGPLVPSITPFYDIRRYGRDGLELSALPDSLLLRAQSMTLRNGTQYFDRISNLVTVRSDVFTAYILVRIGPNGPQKRVIAILDRSGVTPTGGKVKIVAIQPVPDQGKLLRILDCGFRILNNEQLKAIADFGLRI